LNFQQLRSASAAAHSGFNLTEAAQQLRMSQSGISRQIRELEDEIGLQLFKRSGKRFTGLTDSGKRIMPIVARILAHEQQLRSVSRNALPALAGCLRIATTPTQARYVLPKAVLAFRAQHPQIEIQLHQGSSEQVARMLRDGTADVGLAMEALSAHADLLSVPCSPWNHLVIVPPGHALRHATPLSHEALARYTIVTHAFTQNGREEIERLCTASGLTLPKSQDEMDEMDDDVVKTYVRLGLGVGVITDMAWDAQRDAHLVALEASHLFLPRQTYLAVRHGMGLYPFQLEFIQGVAPSLNDAQRRAFQALVRFPNPCR